MKSLYHQGGSVHGYFGRNNGRGGRQRSKIYKGIKVSFKKLLLAFKKIEKEHAENKLRQLSD